MRAQLFAHPVYAAVDSVPRLRRFMEDHIFAVWDFMSLAKRLQRDLTCTALPWTPPADARLARFINEVVLAEESDVGPGGAPASHTEMYLAAMDEVGADAGRFRAFLDAIGRGIAPHTALLRIGAPEHVLAFVTGTLEVALEGELIEVAAAFFHGREDVIPEMFRRLLGLWRHGAADVPRFTYYLERHIALDGEAHGPAARVMLDALAGVDPGRRARVVRAGVRAIEARLRLWDGVLAGLQTVPGGA